MKIKLDLLLQIFYDDGTAADDEDEDDDNDNEDGDEKYHLPPSLHEETEDGAQAQHHRHPQTTMWRVQGTTASKSWLADNSHDQPCHAFIA